MAQCVETRRGEELVDDMDGYQQYAARANDIASKIASVNPGGMLYGLTRSPQNMLHSVFDIDRFWRYIDFMPGLLDDLDYLLDENAAPFCKLWQVFVSSHEH